MCVNLIIYKDVNSYFKYWPKSVFLYTLQNLAISLYTSA